LNLYYNYAKAPTSTYFYNEFTIVIWFNKYYGADYFFSLALIDFSLDNSQNIGLGVVNNKIVFFAKNATGSIITLDSDYRIIYKEWYHIAITYSNDSKLIKLYVNGVLVNSLYVNLRLGETNLNYIGRSDTLNRIGSEVLIDEIRIYNRALSSIEIKIDSNDRLISTTPSATTTTRIDKCKYHVCYNGGICYTSYGYAYCSCISNYYGDNCESIIFF